VKSVKNLNLLVLSLVLCMALACPVASAHRVVVQGYVNEIAVKAYYGGGGMDPMAYADVEVYAIRDGQEDELYLTGEADEDGMYYFAPKIGISEYNVVVSSLGHKGNETVNLSEGAGLAEAEQDEAEDGTKLPLRDVIAGFGYLTGIAGIAMILAARKMNK
jgi:nickel transport protein